MTSHDVINRLRRILGIKSIGHGGTLDPGAAGVLIVAIGKATRIIEFIAEENKTYHVIMQLGTATTTQDAFGITTFRGDLSHLTTNEVSEIISSFCGNLWQIPPMYSAIKQHGKKLYELARSGIEVPRAPRLVEIISLRIIKINLPQVIFEVSCSKGTYIRTLCHDIGLKLGCGGYLLYLLRTSIGTFNLESSFTLEEIAMCYQSGNLSFLTTMPGALNNNKWQKIPIANELAEQVKKGQNIPILIKHLDNDNKKVAVLSDENNLVAIGNIIFSNDDTFFKPNKVFI
jgi:tRNA pseudouridine55 synthase